MKQLFTILFLAVFSISIHAQCDVNVFVNQTNDPVCFGEDLTFLGYGNTACALPFTIQYTWLATAEDETGTEVSLPELTASGTATTLTTIPMFTFSSNNGLTLTSVCLTVQIMDQNMDLAGSGTGCSSSISYPEPMVVSALMSSNFCGNTSCISDILVSGGSAPYVYDLGNGEIWTPNSYYCYEMSGVYQVSVMDANGCYSSTSVVVSGENNNTICENAIVLENGVVLNDTLCAFAQGTAQCSAVSYYEYGWFVVNSGEFSHINLSIVNNFYPGVVYQPAFMEVYEEIPGQGCSDANFVYCNYVNNSASCFDLADQITIQPNTNYYIRGMVMWTVAAPVQLLAVLSNDAIDPICGCNDITSCNYDPDALISDNSCGYSGCTDPGACNYVAYASCDDGSCVFGSDFTGRVFHDLNGDGTWTSYPVEEPSLGNIGAVHVEELDITIYPDGNGEFVLPGLDPGVYHVTFADNSGIWELGITSPLEITLPTCAGLQLPIVPTSGAAAQFSGNSAFWWSTLHCTNGMTQGIYVQNTGAVPLNGVFTMTMDPTLVISGYTMGPAADAEENGVVSWNIVNQLPGTIVYYMAHIAGPGASFVGTNYTFNFDLVLADDNSNTFYDESWSNDVVVTCAYDPNDKAAFPEGYSDEHFILANQEIQYTIRFQNTGNAPAFNVRIEDQLDVEHLDLSTFQPVAASHSYSTIVHPDGLIEFVFDQIMLPDSGLNEPESHGFVVYKIAPVSQIELGAVIENTASIYFDENPAIVTNTTHHTIYDCSLIQSIASEDEICAGLTYSYDLNDPNIETYQWFVNGELISNESYLTYVSEVAADLDITVIRSNPLCTVEQSMILHNHPTPSADITENGSILIAPAGSEWQWYLNDQLISGATSQSYSPSLDGTYSVNTINEFGCVTTSENILFVGITESYENKVQLYPNPMSTQSRLVLPSGKNDVTIYNSLGEISGHYRQMVNSMILEKSLLPAGVYLVRITRDNGQLDHLTLVVN